MSDISGTPFVLPLRQHHDTPYIVMDADGNQVANCSDWKDMSMPRPDRIRLLHNAEDYAAAIVELVNRGIE